MKRLCAKNEILRGSYKKEKKNNPEVEKDAVSQVIKTYGRLYNLRHTLITNFYLQEKNI